MQRLVDDLPSSGNRFRKVLRVCFFSNKIHVLLCLSVFIPSPLSSLPPSPLSLFSPFPSSFSPSPFSPLSLFLFPSPSLPHRYRLMSCSFSSYQQKSKTKLVVTTDTAASMNVLLPQVFVECGLPLVGPIVSHCTAELSDCLDSPDKQAKPVLKLVLQLGITLQHHKQVSPYIVMLVVS